MKFFGSKNTEARETRASGKFSNKRAVAATAAALLFVIGAVVYFSRPQVFLGIFADDSGLAMVREVVRAHGGKIEVHENKHGGTTFEVKLSIGAEKISPS